MTAQTEGRQHQTTLRLAPDELVALRDASHALGVPIGRLIRQALVSQGILPQESALPGHYAKVRKRVSRQGAARSSA